MKKLDIGPLRLAVVGRVYFVDWRMNEVGNRWRIVAGPHPLWLPLRATPRKWQAGPITIAWYAKGVE